MKHCIFLLSFSLLAANSIFGQSNCKPLSISDILPMAKMTYDDFDTYVTGKCFNYDKNVTQGETKKRQYKWTGDYKTAPEIIIYGTDDNGKMFITYNTWDDIKYASLKKEIKTLGFKLTDQSNSSSDFVWFTYRNATNEISVSSFNDPGLYKYAFIIKKL